ncbi:MAG: hypothetical protein ACREUX_09200, partial [Burkholderiales bacterium]
MAYRDESRKTQCGGTRFKLYPQSPVLSQVPGPETVWIARAPGTIGPGPSDERMYVVDALGKPGHYEYPFLPPWRGAQNPAVMPGPDGHFDHLEPGSRAFMAAHMYGTVRFVLDIWESYMGAEIPWHFAPALPRLELVPVIEWDNAHAGYGFIETGFAGSASPARQPFCLNFDVLAHELGHTLVYALIGTPPVARATAAYHAFHESAADCIAMISVLHFESVMDRLLERTRGNLYLPNELNRIGELSETEQIRQASNSLKLADVPDLHTPVERLSQPQRHVMSLPLTGAVFDMMVDVYQELLVQDGLIGRDLDIASRPEIRPSDERAVQVEFDRCYRGRHDEFKKALRDARDYMGRSLAAAWRRLSWDLSYSQFAAELLDVDACSYRGAGRNIIIESLEWRGIVFPFGRGQRIFRENLSATRGLA